ncbi:614 534 cytochrome P450 [Coniophora puteana RWD-64-598 SS2]|uniref:614 534 cytochrome P450 n=1 Tax=Coniophora puteana (strain RWD-64-598) TaxID=741705 RepID=A0A5M3MGJ1_CONPW|nr:614 534 cytochrome P450 [Coniophora puteana RWD-64-598 SS2]EIW78358.1 614 534 cytochrome P450 [Coniophora puteana RWD-64-598 SS2]
MGNIVPQIRGISLGQDHLWKMKHTTFEKHGLDIVSSIGFFPKARASLWVADAMVIKDMVWSRRFPKPLFQYKILTFFGENIVVSEGEEWKRYRKIVAPAFSERNNRLVWDETTRIMLDLFDNEWKGKQEVAVDHGVDLTLPLALFIIGAAGFGRQISWAEDAIVPPGHQMTFKEALHFVTQNLVIKLTVPKFALGWTKVFRQTRLAFEELHQYLDEMIKERRSSEKSTETHDLFSSLLKANEDDGVREGEVKLSNSELIGNIFIFLVAGHETTAHSLSFALAMLALYPDVQEKLYQHISSVLPDRRIPTYDDMPQLTYSLATFNESLRMFSPVTAVPKQSNQDTTLVVTDTNGEKRTINVPKDTILNLDMPGVHYNPKYWEDPHTFNPERFLGEWNRDAFIPFSAGYRACVGRKFSEAEGTAVLTLLISRYRVEIKDEPQFAHETWEQRKERVLRAESRVTLAPVRVPLVFKKRD